MSEASVTGAPSSATTPALEGLSSQAGALPQTPVDPGAAQVAAVSGPDTREPAPPDGPAGIPAPAGPTGPKIKRPSIIVEPDEIVRELWRAICQECTWTCGPSVKFNIEEMAVWHRGEHRVGAVPAPLRDAEEAQRRAAVGLERDIRALIAGRGGAHSDDIADGLARLGWRHP